ncbi:MAG: bifunctional ADP-dependent NAD(P)H-hydrate dehydratase/NAD(P)H-hydrate epimerase [Bacteroidetes bacterium]|nr:MAG: bifunctional ADP-dependent NAD(P)H-hydrate dehydratase/NAD(P)H-hydrate epimerase [Bacteroidota bacterium]PTM12271.1 MAG: bifunctional ADP-dependent NAD(P)H-hydrate dehydratase/NAD(P)H-hydrate epimerase [Bacteroidota bacterium]
MQKILAAHQIRHLDEQTIREEPIASLDLMERASLAFVQAFRAQFSDLDRPITILCGDGNNGGDGLAIARRLHELSYEVFVLRARMGNTPSPDNATNWERLQAKRVIACQELTAGDPLPELPASGILIDGLLGSGLSRPVTGYWAGLIDHLNTLDQLRIAIDIPSGLFVDQPTTGSALQAAYTFTFQVPKLAFFAPENAPYVGEWQVLDIGLLPSALAAAVTKNYYVQLPDVAALLKTRGRFDHKGTFGHALIVAGSYGKIGAAILSARAALRAGCGLVTVHLPRCGYEIMQIAFPEAMVQVDRHQFICTQVPQPDTYSAIGIGPGIGTNPVTQAGLHQLLEQSSAPLVLDADALNILGLQPSWQTLLPANSILTPHPKEFERLFGPTANSFERWERLRHEAQRLQCYILLKGGYSAIATPTGEVYFATVGNPGMGTAGAGDVLTGIVTGLLAQGYPVETAILLGVCLHGLAGDLAAEAQQMESLIAEDIIQYLGAAFGALRRIGEV